MKPLTVQELADEWLHCSPETAAQALASGDLPGLQYGRGWIVPVGALLDRLDELARQQASERRAPRETPTEFDLTTLQRGRQARVPPALPKLNTGVER